MLDVLRVLSTPKVYKKIVGSRFWVSCLIFPKKILKNRKNHQNAPPAPQKSSKLNISDFSNFHKKVIGVRVGRIPDVLTVLAIPKVYKKIVGSRFWVPPLTFSKKILKILKIHQK